MPQNHKARPAQTPRRAWHHLALLAAALIGGPAYSEGSATKTVTFTFLDLSSVALEVDGVQYTPTGLTYEATIPYLPQSIRLRQWHAWDAVLTDARGVQVRVAAPENFDDPQWVGVPLVGLTAPLTLRVSREE